MKFTLFALVAAVTTHAAYPGDIVKYWVDQSAIIVNGTIIGGLPSPPSGWFEAIVQGSVYLAATQSKNASLEFQQLAVSHAAHDSLLWVFHGTRIYANVDGLLRNILPAIGLNSSAEAQAAIKIGREAAQYVTTARANDGIDDFVDYNPAPLDSPPGVYLATPGGQPIPDTPQAQYIRLFGGLGDVKQYRAPPPPSVTNSTYEAYVTYVKEIGERNSTRRSEEETKTAYLWRESSPIGWNRFAGLVIGDRWATNVLESAKFYAVLNYALSNAAIASWDTKYTYNYWRPVTAIRRPGTWLPSGLDVYDPNWTPLLTPTPNHQDYTSTHSTFGGAAAAVIRAYNGGDNIDILFSSNVTVDNVGVLTRRYTSVTQAAVDNANSRVFGGIHFEYATRVGVEAGEIVGKETVRLFDEHWSEF